jgi:hypothetical protein
MEYKLCSINSFRLLELTLFRTEKEFDKKKPAIIYIVVPKGMEGYRRMAEARATAYKTMGTAVKILMENKDKKEIEAIINKCLKARVIQNPSMWG